MKRYTASSWARLVPLSHAYKQLRNDLMSWRYNARTPPDLPTFLDSVRALQASNLAIVIAFEQPWVLDWMLRLARLNLRDCQPLVFDNSRSAEKRAEIAAVCARLGVPYLALPLNQSRHPNRSHGMAMNWIYRHVITALKPQLFAYLDHDLIPLQPLSLAEQVGDQPFYGAKNPGIDAWNLWAGYCAFRFAQVAGKPVNFLYDFSRELDTGGRNWPVLYRQVDEAALRFASNEWLEFRPGDGADPGRVQVIDGAWLHIGGVSYGSNFKDKQQLCTVLEALSTRGDSGAILTGRVLAQATQ
ncbi:MAG: hypothetical protein RL375_2982 [Pseudomonadota bacterium]